MPATQAVAAPATTSGKTEVGSVKAAAPNVAQQPNRPEPRNRQRRLGVPLSEQLEHRRDREAARDIDR